jgi:acetate---CoA ligase (ADP-forming) subunit beta
MTEQPNKKRLMLTEVEAKKLLEQAGIPVVATRLARTKHQAASLSREIGFPVVLKIVSPDVVHKSDAGGVKVGLANTAQVLKAYSEIISNVKKSLPGARIEGVSVQKMAPPGVEVIIGMSEDAQFGPFIMFGLGGIWVEVLKDVTFRLVPVTARDAAEMVREIKGFDILRGYRGQEPIDIPFLEKLIVKVSEFIERNPRVRELDINPLVAYGDGAVAVDARIIIGPSMEGAKQ